MYSLTKMGIAEDNICSHWCVCVFVCIKNGDRNKVGDRNKLEATDAVLHSLGVEHNIHEEKLVPPQPSCFS